MATILPDLMFSPTAGNLRSNIYLNLWMEVLR
jgi:hypothetical protein